MGDNSNKAQASTVPDTVSGAAVTAAVVTLTDTIALSNQAAGATGGTVTYTWATDVSLATGTTLAIVLPGFSGTPATSSTCANGGGTALAFDIATSGSGAGYTVTLTTKDVAVATGQNCAVEITGLTVTATAGNPAYRVTVDDNSNKAQASTVPDTVSGAAVTAAVVTLTDTIALSNQAAGATGGTV